MFENKPHVAHRHESVLLKENKSTIFQDYHSKLPYYVTSYAFLKFEKYLRENNVNKIVRTYKPHIMMMFRQAIGGYVPSFTKETMIDAHAEKILKILRDSKNSKTIFDEIINLFIASMNKWETELGKSKRGTKDVEAFTKHLLDQVNLTYHGSEGKVENKLEFKDPVFLGQVVNVVKDRYGKYYGFISKTPDDIFFHSNDNIDFDCSNLKNKKVLYVIKEDIKSKVDFKKAVIRKVI